MKHSFLPIFCRPAAHVLLVVLFAISGCGDLFSLSPAIRFTMPLSINGKEVGDVIIDTGGDYELMLGHDHGLPVIDETEVLIFGGRETVQVVGEFDYAVGGVRASANSAIVGVPICNCNGLGFPFFRKTGMTLGLDFETSTADFHAIPPEEGVVIPFDSPPAYLPTFDSAFISVLVYAEGPLCEPREGIIVEVADDAGGELNTPEGRKESADCSARRLSAILDTGASETLIRRGLITETPTDWLGRVPVKLHHPQLGTVHVSARQYDNPELPDLIVGTNVMRAWSPRWHFTYDPQGGWITAYPRNANK